MQARNMDSLAGFDLGAESIQNFFHYHRSNQLSSLRFDAIFTNGRNVHECCLAL